MTDRLTSVRKAAILIASLDVRTADALLEQMSAEQARLVRDTLTELGDTDACEQRAVIEEFFRIGPLVPVKAPPGIELDDQSARQRSLPPAPLDSIERAPRAASRPTAAFRFLDDAPV